ncbi:uncharacterized protein LOC114270393 [Camellia sinensis]|uniref:uncharacterized protein LOC114270393 n=1 Tax=Camellia sinensis TaxID=4442 RepID=UPI001035D839|nr:uncharacterized protein LOC114270393 [Camellia sinensis]
MFVARFVTNKLQPLRIDSLIALRIGEDERIRVYAKKYYEGFNRIPRCNQELAVVSFKNCLNDDYILRKSLAKTLLKSMEELMARIEKYARAKEDMPGMKASKQEKRNGSPKRGRGNTNFSKQETGLRAAQAMTTVFRIPVYKVLERIRNQPYYRTSERIPRIYVEKFGEALCLPQRRWTPDVGL